MKRSIPWIALALLALLYACSTKLNIDAPYKETMIVYGLLDQKDTTHYIRIEKAYLGPGNALQMAKIYDSINYGNTLTVKLQQWSNGNLLNTITLTRDSSVSKASGLFSNPYQVLYKTKASLDSSCQYNLIVTNNATHNVVTGSTVLISGLQITPLINLQFTNPSPVRILWNSAINGVVYNVVMRFYYYEKSRITNTVTKKYLDWDFGNMFTGSNQSNASVPMEIDITGVSFYQYLQNNLPPLNTTTTWRYVSSDSANASLLFNIGSQDLSTYIIISQPTNSITQTQPQFTDIGNGYGLFASRFQTSMGGLYLTLNSIDSLYNGRFTANLFSSP